ncbi:Uncharacterised protein [Mycobacteroides abscessus subsp. abscessus]|nr:Uncharacterised protein [Mycobacteroides abscessus subsp. abscessus]
MPNRKGDVDSCGTPKYGDFTGCAYSIRYSGARRWAAARRVKARMSWRIRASPHNSVHSASGSLGLPSRFAESVYKATASETVESDTDGIPWSRMSRKAACREASSVGGACGSGALGPVKNEPSVLV